MLVQALLPLDMRAKKTRAIRKRLTKEQVRGLEVDARGRGPEWGLGSMPRHAGTGCAGACRASADAQVDLQRRSSNSRSVWQVSCSSTG